MECEAAEFRSREMPGKARLTMEPSSTASAMPSMMTAMALYRAGGASPSGGEWMSASGGGTARLYPRVARRVGENVAPASARVQRIGNRREHVGAGTVR